MPRLRHFANLWTLMGHNWTLREKITAMRDAGFDGVCWAPSAELLEEAERAGLLFVGGMASSRKAEFAGLLEDLKRFGAHHVNVQLGTDSMLTPEALDLTLEIMAQGKRLGLEPAIETHRGTCTETPEKMYALADAYLAATGDVLPISFDFSHFAVVKHLLPTEFIPRLLVRPELVAHARQFHFRPFNGHHVQVPTTYGAGHLTPEVEAWLPFAEAVLRLWAQAHAGTEDEIFVCPELGPVEGGYCLSTFPDSWEEAKVLRGVIADLWSRVTTA